MIYIIEIPHQRPVTGWSRNSAEEVITVIEQSSQKSGDTVYEEMTGGELLEMHGYESTAEMREDNDMLEDLANLIDQHGLETTFYSSFEDDYTAEPNDKLQVYLDYNSHDLHSQKVFMTDEEARQALANNNEWKGHQGLQARIALENAIGDVAA